MPHLFKNERNSIRMRLYVINAVDNIAAGISIVKGTLRALHHAENGNNPDVIAALMNISLLERDLASLKKNMENTAKA